MPPPPSVIRTCAHTWLCLKLDNVQLCSPAPWGLIRKRPATRKWWLWNAPGVLPSRSKWPSMVNQRRAKTSVPRNWLNTRRQLRLSATVRVCGPTLCRSAVSCLHAVSVLWGLPCSWKFEFARYFVYNLSEEPGSVSFIARVAVNLVNAIYYIKHSGVGFVHTRFHLRSFPIFVSSCSFLSCGSDSVSFRLSCECI